MTAAVIAGMLVGIGVWLAWAGLRPSPEPLGVVLARFDAPHVEESRREATHPPDLARDIRFGRFLLQRMPLLVRSIDRMRADLRIVGRTPEEHAARVGSYVLLALGMGVWVMFVTWVVGLTLPPFVPGSLALVGAAWGVVVPFTTLRSEAKARRQAFGHALSAWCDVVVMSLASGRGVEQAMETAAMAGRGWAFAEIRSALHAGYVRGETPWVALGHLGAEFGMSDLSELASTIAMAGEEGAAVRTTVAGKARTIRERITSETELAAAAATERMSLPSVVLVLGFLLFLGYPAVHIVFQL